MGECKKIKGKFVLMKKNILDFNDFHASVLDRFHELHGKRLSLQLISSVNGQPTGELILTFLNSDHILEVIFCFRKRTFKRLKTFCEGVYW